MATRQSPAPRPADERFATVAITCSPSIRSPLALEAVVTPG
jgi:hypothetical protein